MSRVYLDWNATAPLRPEARAAMLGAMDTVGNPSSVHAEGRAARAIVEKARGQVAGLVGCDLGEIVFTSGASEGARCLLSRVSPHEVFFCRAIEHDAVAANVEFPNTAQVTIDATGRVRFDYAAIDTLWERYKRREPKIVAITGGNGEIGTTYLDLVDEAAVRGRELVFSDVVQVVGRRPFTFAASGLHFGILSGHKLGGPIGAGAMVVRQGAPFAPLLEGGGQEMGRRSGTENVVGIAGFGAAAEAAQRDLEDGVWERVSELRNILEASLEAVAADLIFFGREVDRLPNTTCFAVPGWTGETQVMQLDLAGFAVSAGSACSSGKVRESRMLRAMGYDAETASSAIRVSLGPTTTEGEIRAFAEAWKTLYRKRSQRAA